MPSKLIKVGSISYYEEDVIGEGSFATRVYRGRVGQGNEEAAIKIVPLRLLDMQEVKNLESLQRKNVGEKACNFIVKYILHEVYEDPPIPAVYLATELCTGTLDDFVHFKNSASCDSEGFDNGGLTSKNVIHQLIQAVSFLHSHGIVHRDIKPRNCLISKADTNGKKIVKLSDFGLCAGVTTQKTSSRNTRSLAIGSYGWMAPEVAVAGENKDPSLDIFSLGCVCFYVLSSGRHVFGSGKKEGEIDLVSCQKSINRNDRICFQEIRRLDCNEMAEYENVLAQMLVQKMTAFSPNERPSSQDILQFPFLFDEKQVGQFVHDLGNLVDVPKCKCKPKKESCTCGVEKKITPQSSELLKTLNETDKTVMKGNWYKNLEPIIQTYCLSEFNKKDGENFSALCRAVRNNHEHWTKYQGNKEVVKLFGTTAHGVIEYYCKKFPQFLYNTFMCYHETMDPSKRSKIRSWRVIDPAQSENKSEEVSIVFKSVAGTQTEQEVRRLVRKFYNKIHWNYTLAVFIGLLSIVCVLFFSIQTSTDAINDMDKPQDEANVGEDMASSEYPLQMENTSGQALRVANEDKPLEPMHVGENSSKGATGSGGTSVDRMEMKKMTEELKSEFSVDEIVSHLSDFLGDGMRIERNIFGRQLIIELSLYFHRFKTYQNARVTDVLTGIRVNSKDRKKCLGKSCAIENGLYSIIDELRRRGIDIKIVD